MATLYGYDDSQNNRVIGEQGRSNKSNRENSERNGRGRKGSQSAKKAIQYNFKEREITYSNETISKFSLKGIKTYAFSLQQKNHKKIPI